MIALETCSLNKSFGSLAVTQEVSLAFKAGLRYAIIGPNGAGKTTYFNLLAGNLRPDSGAILLEGRDVTTLDVTSRARIGISRSFQRNSLFSDFTVRDNLLLACALRAGRAPIFWRSMRSLNAPLIEADEIAAWTVVAFTGRFGFTAALSARLLQPIRIGALVAGRGSIIGKASGRVVRVEVQLEQNDKVAYTGELTFALLDEASAQRLLGRPLPESWKQFARGGRHGEA